MRWSHPFVILAVIYSALQGIFITALYTYAKTGTVPSGSDKDLIQNAFTPKQQAPAISEFFFLSS
jgi:hypothetical protein